MAAHALRSAGGAAIACCNSVYVDLRNRSMNSPLSTTGSGLAVAAGDCGCPGAPIGCAANGQTTAITAAANTARQVIEVMSYRAKNGPDEREMGPRSKGRGSRPIDILST